MRMGGVSNLLLLATSVGWLTTAALMPAQKAAAQPKVSFSRDVLPILSDKCFLCHGPDAGSRMADLRLDLPKSAFAERGGRWAIVPGKPEHSLVVKRISSHDTPMPPKASGKTLTPKEIATIKLWISQGAVYGKLWSLEPLPAVVPVPKVNGTWPRDDLDRFVLARLNKEKLAPSAPAPRLRWLRRVTLDLTGLPPTEQEIAAFLDDKQPNAYGKVVDRLLASPRFGERMAVEWLDAARYSDSYGYQSDLLMPTWPYRDWVVNSFNQNLPYDQFLVDQLAGDLLPNATRDQRLATAFNRLHRQSNEGGSIALEFKTEYAVDRVSTYGTAVLGLTLGCARCHDHKFDPITQKEFYQLFAYFNSIEEYGLLLSTEIVPTPSLLLPTSEQETKLKELRAKNTEALQALAQETKAAEARFKAWTPSAGQLPVVGVLARLPLDEIKEGKFANALKESPFGAPMGRVNQVAGRNGKAALMDGENGIVVRNLTARERWDAFTWLFWIVDPRPTNAPVILLHRTGGTDVGFCGFDLTLEDGFLTARVMRHWPGNALAIRTKSRVPKNQWAQVAWSWDGSGRAAGLKLYLNGKPAETTVLADKLWKKIYAYGDLGPSGGDWAFGQRFRDLGFKGGKLDDLVYADRALSPLEIGSLHGEYPENEEALRAYYVSAVDAKMHEARAAVKKAQEDLAKFEEGIYETSVMEEAKKPIPTYLLARGQYDAPRTAANLVTRGVPKALPPLKAAATNDRLTLAKWSTQPNHPLTARVAVNRLWQMLFGVGLVETSENFGVQGSQPTHPELLDFLARRFVNSGWNVKATVKSIVLSATYRQDSARTHKGKDVDPDNRLFSRGPSNRLSAEMVRDTALSASGLLNDRIGGPPVNPYQPAGIWQENNTMSPAFVQSKGADLYRRSLYSTWKRTTPVPSMLLFDATSREACVTRRPATNTPLQALVLLNDVQFVEASRALAEFVLKSKARAADRIKSAFVRLSGREPDTREMAVLLETLREQQVQFETNPELAKKLIAVGDSKADPTLDVSELAAMTITVQTILNSDAVFWKR
jgi:mono/diheme cytochrome c family protein